MNRGPKPVVEYDGKTYTCKAYNAEIPDLPTLSRFEALGWLLRNTTPKGYSHYVPNLRGLNATFK